MDQTVIGNPAHDLIRLGLSLATAIRGSNLAGVTAALVLEQAVAGYEKAFSRSFSEAGNARDVKPVRRILKKALKRKWHHLAQTLKISVLVPMCGQGSVSIH
jgi:uncharacterized protein (DUF2252 family)